ncbi:hypothetical protein BCR37DRAFT_393470 [Protomyces lactucae-debilis]|uniref:Uncharacterized protein n=1 Tax=Protomyces lactucae-debilis TaxID=2754530 RepID=A0A1Y2FA63_PROLT|nr:uncharacterized protein BCR37DRAFT_393470 [Protomyces lactucae-debilis]ORY80798.1 hypothetical protein BCR37DRAFT_393470 [Protomyces lactucae-debilis]
MAIEDVSLAGSEPELVMGDESDPEEVDISTVDTDIMTPHLRQRAPLYGPPRPPHMQQAPADFAGMPMEDPFAILQQMGIGQRGAGGDPFGFSGGQGFPQSPAGMSSHQQQQQKQQTEAAQKTARTNKLWQVLHLSAIALLVIFLRRESIPSYGLRAPSKIGGQAEPIFWYCATIELILQTLRFFIGGAQVQGSMIATMALCSHPHTTSTPWYSHATVSY